MTKCNNEDIVEMKETIIKTTKYLGVKLDEINNKDGFSFLLKSEKSKREGLKLKENLEKGFNEKFCLHKSYCEDNSTRNVFNLGKYYKKKQKIKLNTTTYIYIT